MLEITGVTAGYGRTKVLHDVTIQIPTGSAVSARIMSNALEI